MPGEFEKLLMAMQRQATNDKRPLKKTPRLVANGKNMPKGKNIFFLDALNVKS
jgi:hypothetical protein